MKLFFETAVQARVFLAAIPIGILLGIFLDLGELLGRARFVADILAMLMATAGLVIMSMLSLENGLQLYHLLAVAVGVLIYLCGVGRLLRLLRMRLSKRKVSERTVRMQEKDL